MYLSEINASQKHLQKSFLSFKKSFIYLLKSHSERKRKREKEKKRKGRERPCPLSILIPKHPQQPGLDQNSMGLEFHLGLLQGQQGPKHLGHPPLSSQACQQEAGQELGQPDLNWHSDMECRNVKWRLSLLQHNTCPYWKIFCFHSLTQQKCEPFL